MTVKTLCYKSWELSDVSLTLKGLGGSGEFDPLLIDFKKLYLLEIRWSQARPGVLQYCHSHIISHISENLIEIPDVVQ